MLNLVGVCLLCLSLPPFPSVPPAAVVHVAGEGSRPIVGSSVRGREGESRPSSLARTEPRAVVTFEEVMIWDTPRVQRWAEEVAGELCDLTPITPDPPRGG
jgi:hypothetical protein